MLLGGSYFPAGDSSALIQTKVPVLERPGLGAEDVGGTDTNGCSSTAQASVSRRGSSPTTATAEHRTGRALTSADPDAVSIDSTLGSRQRRMGRFAADPRVSRRPGRRPWASMTHKFCRRGPFPLGLRPRGKQHLERPCRASADSIVTGTGKRRTLKQQPKRTEAAVRFPETPADTGISG